MKIIGIDSGSRGAIAQIDTDLKRVTYLNIPYRSDKLIDFDIIKNAFHWHDVSMTYIEHVRGRGGIWGANQNFTFGFNYGLIRGFLYDKPHVLVTPKLWQKVAHLGSKKDLTAKEKSYETFIRLNPTANIAKSKDGIIDAFHIARYGLLQYPKNILLNQKWDFQEIKVSNVRKALY